MALEIIESTKNNTVWSIKTQVNIAIICLLVGATIFILAFIGMTQNYGIGAFNQPVLDWMISHRSSSITNIMKIITDSANPIMFVAIVGTIAGLWVIIKREIWRPILLVGSVGFVAGLSTLLKIVTANSRPLTTDMIAPLEIDYSFPSGHTIGVIVSLLTLGYLLYSRRSSFGRIFGWVFATVLGTALVATSRLYLGYHWLTDVIASVGLGLIILALVITADLITDKYFKR